MIRGLSDINKNIIFKLRNCIIYISYFSNFKKACTDTPGAYLWRPNSRAKSDAVRNKFNIGTLGVKNLNILSIYVSKPISTMPCIN